MWLNTNNQGLDYEERTCCLVGTNNVTDECPKQDEIRDTRISDAAIFGMLFGAFLFVELAFCYYCFYRRKRRNAQA